MLLYEIITPFPSIPPTLSGIPYKIHVRTKDEVHERHGPSIKIEAGKYVGTSAIPITISDKPYYPQSVLNNIPGLKDNKIISRKNLKKIQGFIIKNKIKLLEYWNQNPPKDFHKDIEPYLKDVQGMEFLIKIQNKQYKQAMKGI